MCCGVASVVVPSPALGVMSEVWWSRLRCVVARTWVRCLSCAGVERGCTGSGCCQQWIHAACSCLMYGMCADPWTAEHLEQQQLNVVIPSATASVLQL